MKVIHNRNILIERRKDLRNHATPQEVLLWSKLKNSQLGYKFRRQQGVGDYIVDFYCPFKKIIIEIDGSQHFQSDAQLYDTKRSEYFNKLQIIVLRFTNAEINTNLEGVLLKIQGILESPPLTPPQ